MYSSVNHMMQTASIVDRVGLSVGLPYTKKASGSYVFDSIANNEAVKVQNYLIRISYGLKGFE